MFRLEAFKGKINLNLKIFLKIVLDNFTNRCDINILLLHKIREISKARNSSID